VSNSELDGWDLVTRERPARRLGRRRDVVIGVVAALFLGYGVWALVAVHPGGPLGNDWEPLGGATVCGPAPLAQPGDLTQGIGAQLPGGLAIQSVLLIGAHGVSLVEARLGTVALVNDTWVAPNTEPGWPNVANSTMVAGSLVPVDAARTEGGAGQVLVLHLRLNDAQHAGFDDVAVVYRSGVFRYERRFGITYRYVPTAECA